MAGVNKEEDMKQIWIRQRWLRVSTIVLSIACILLLSLAGVLNYRPDTSVPFPMITPPQGPQNAYLMTSLEGLIKSFTQTYATPFDADRYAGQSFLVQKVELTKRGKGTSVIDGSLYVNYAQFIPRNPADLKKFHPGDQIDVLGTCNGFSKTGITSVIFSDCIFMPTGTAPFPLPGAPGFSAGGY
jgi:hypothetical protein